MICDNLRVSHQQKYEMWLDKKKNYSNSPPLQPMWIGALGRLIAQITAYENTIILIGAIFEFPPGA